MGKGADPAIAPDGGFASAAPGEVGENYSSDPLFSKVIEKHRFRKQYAAKFYGIGVSSKGGQAFDTSGERRFVELVASEPPFIIAQFSSVAFLASARESDSIGEKTIAEKIEASLGQAEADIVAKG